MERERPEYLPPIKGRRWEFPWLLLIGIALAAIMVGGVSMLAKTNAAWAKRFDTNARVTADSAGQTGATPVDPPVTRGRRQDANTAAQRQERRMRDSDRATENERTRCISGTVFRRIPGGWENVPGMSCQP